MDQNAEELSGPKYTEAQANIIRSRYGGAFADCSTDELVKIIADPYWAWNKND